MQLDKIDSQLLRYMVDKGVAPGDRLPPLADLSAEMGVSVGKLREELEVARSLGIVSVRPRLGIRREPFDFQPAVLTSLLFALATNAANFAQFSYLRRCLEVALWDEAVASLTAEDKTALAGIVSRAWCKLLGNPPHVPTGEHRDFHLKIFSHLDNPFIQGIFDAYWDAYEASELTRFMPGDYWLTVWTYHQQIVEALLRDDFAGARTVLVEHFNLLPAAPVAADNYFVLGENHS
jgi:DNA-binding FadR family transcriptional regulator